MNTCTDLSVFHGTDKPDYLAVLTETNDGHRTFACLEQATGRCPKCDSLICPRHLADHADGDFCE